MRRLMFSPSLRCVVFAVTGLILGVLMVALPT
jgi:hypothetical protein